MPRTPPPLFRIFASCLFFFFLSATAFSAPAAQDPYFAAGASSVKLLEVKRGVPSEPEALSPLYKDGHRLGLANAGLVAWQVIKSGRPSAEAETAYASALPPALVSNWSAVSGWQGPQEHTYEYSVTNKMGVEVIRARYRISFSYGGATAAGPVRTGSYISDLTVKPLEVHVAWGWRFDLGVNMMHPMNMGTVADPLARMQVELKWHSYTIISKGDYGVWTYVLDGRGNYREIAEEKIAPAPALPEPAALTLPEVRWN